MSIPTRRKFINSVPQFSPSPPIPPTHTSSCLVFIRIIGIQITHFSYPSTFVKLPTMDTSMKLLNPKFLVSCFNFSNLQIFVNCHLRVNRLDFSNLVPDFPVFIHFFFFLQFSCFLIFVGPAFFSFSLLQKLKRNRNFQF